MLWHRLRRGGRRLKIRAASADRPRTPDIGLLADSCASPQPPRSPQPMVPMGPPQSTHAPPPDAATHGLVAARRGAQTHGVTAAARARRSLGHRRKPSWGRSGSVATQRSVAAHAIVPTAPPHPIARRNGNALGSPQPMRSMQPVGSPLPVRPLRPGREFGSGALGLMRFEAARTVVRQFSCRGSMN